MGVLQVIFMPKGNCLPYVLYDCDGEAVSPFPHSKGVWFPAVETDPLVGKSTCPPVSNAPDADLWGHLRVFQALVSTLPL